MFGLSMGQVLIIVLVGVFLLGPDRIPVAVQWTTGAIRKVRTMAQGAQAQLRTEIGPELDELRRQIADLQSLKELQELRALRDLNPRNLIGKSVLGEEFGGGGISGFLGLNGNPLTAADPAAPTVTLPDPATVAAERAAAAADPAEVSLTKTSGEAANEPAAPAPAATPAVDGADAASASGLLVADHGAPRGVAADPFPPSADTAADGAAAPAAAGGSAAPVYDPDAT